MNIHMGVLYLSMRVCAACPTYTPKIANYKWPIEDTNDDYLYILTEILYSGFRSEYI